MLMYMADSIPLDITASLRRRPSRQFIWASCILLSFLFFCFTDPRNVPNVVLIAGFIILAAFIYGCLSSLIYITSTRAKLKPQTRRILLVSGTMLPVLLLVLQSIGQLTVRDVLTMSGLFVIGMFYVTRIRSST